MHEEQIAGNDAGNTSMLVLMVRGLLTDLKFSYAQFPWLMLQSAIRCLHTVPICLRHCSYLYTAKYRYVNNLFRTHDNMDSNTCCNYTKGNCANSIKDLEYLVLQGLH